MAGDHATRASTSVEASTSGTAATLPSAAEVSTTASSRRTWSARRNGTTTRDPTSTCEPPASTSTAVSPARTSVQWPVPTASDSTCRCASGGGPGARAASTDANATATTLDHASARTARRAASHAAHVAAIVAIATAGWRRDTSGDGTAVATAEATLARNRAHTAATAPHQSPAVGQTPWIPAAATPPTVASAAAGMVITLSGAASGDNEPPCAMAMGVLTVHATIDAHAEAAMAREPMAIASWTDVRTVNARSTNASVRADHRSVARGATTRSAATTP